MAASPAPHLEYRLQNSKGTPYPFTLPAQFVDYIADGKPVAEGEPVRGQSVRNGADGRDYAAAEKQVDVAPLPTLPDRSFRDFSGCVISWKLMVMQPESPASRTGL